MKYIYCQLQILYGGIVYENRAIYVTLNSFCICGTVKGVYKKNHYMYMQHFQIRSTCTLE